MLKKITLALFVVSFLIIANDAQFNNAHTNSAGAPPARTGSPGDGNVTCNTAGCHTGSAPTSAQDVSITSDVPGTGYIPGNTYTITCTATATGVTKIGFQLSPQNTAGDKLGDFVLPLPPGTAFALPNTGAANKYVTHTSLGTTANGGSKTWTLQWKAPATGSGEVTFYAAFNFTNSSNSSVGDIIKLGTLDISENTSGINDIDGDSRAVNVYPNPVSDAFNITFFMYEQGDVKAEIYDVSGRLIKNEITENVLPGRHIITYNTNEGWSAGVYFVRLHCGQNTYERKVVVK